MFLNLIHDKLAKNLTYMTKFPTVYWYEYRMTLVCRPHLNDTKLLLEQHLVEQIKLHYDFNKPQVSPYGWQPDMTKWNLPLNKTNVDHPIVLAFM